MLGGTREGRVLAARLAGDARYACMLSYAGRTENPELPDLPHRVGGFGGVAGLGEALRQYDALIDATHPFAARISANAVEAARLAGVPLLRWVRPAWEGDWIEVADMTEAANALGPVAKRVFLTIGRLEIAAFRSAPQHHYLVRAVDSFDHGLPNAALITARGPFALADELALLRDHEIELIVSKNAGTSATHAKIEAARMLGVPVIMVARPTLPPAHEVETLEHVLTWLHASSGSERGE